MIRSLSLILTLVVAPIVHGQKEPASEIWELQASGSKASLRGLCIVNNDVVWASGTQGSVLRSVDAGKTWKVVGVSEAKDLDFRDIHAFNKREAVIVSAGVPARVYRTEDGGRSWKNVFEHKNDKAFFDAMDFVGDSGVAFSDPLDDRLEMIATSDRGKSWQQLEAKYRPQINAGEAGFAASGTCLVLHNGKTWIGLGGKHAGGKARLFTRKTTGEQAWSVTDTPLASSQSSGIFSVTFANNERGIVVGGDYLEPESEKNNVAVSEDGGETWRNIKGNPPSGYRSAVAAFTTDSKTISVCVGTNGTDVSEDFGDSWKKLSNRGFHAISFSPDGTAGWAVGSDGRIARLDLGQLAHLLSNGSENKR